MTETEAGIIRILEEFRRLQPGRITPATTINFDLGIDGDDASDLLSDIAARFGVSFAEFEFSRYFGPESISTIAAIRQLIRRSRTEREPLSVSQLAYYIEQKRSSP